jgi:aminotransferase
MDREIARLSAEPGPTFIDVSKGNPDAATPEHIVAAMQREVADPVNHRYLSAPGRASLRRAIARRYREDHGVDLDPDAEVAVSHGSHEAILAAVMALADPGTNIVLPDPGYPLYTSATGLAGAHLVPLPLPEPRYQPDFAAVSRVTAASLLILNYPNNPTGALATRATFEGAIEFARRTGAAFLHDFAYSSLGFDGHRPLSALAVDSDRAGTVEVQTVSKTYSMAGWRVGYAAGNASILAAIARYQAHAFSTVFGAAQEAAAAALDGDQAAAADLVAMYERRRDVVVAGLRRIGWEVSAPEGTFFVWARVPGGADALEFARRLREERRVAVAPGDGFGPAGRGHIRIGLVRDEETLSELLDRLDAFASRQGVA